MNVAKWGNSLALRLPRPVVEALGLREGDEVVLAATGEGTLTVARDTRREEAIARIRATRWALPAGYRFDREDANGRSGFRSDPDPTNGG